MSNFKRKKVHADDIVINGNSLDITLSLPIIYDGGVATVILDYMYFFEIDKEQAANITKINVTQIEE
ncbi:MAG: hypothetical protein K2N53_00055 [Clostridia bacterium]|nr:hypothetical protein [Clostridia bacterium]